MDEKWFKHQQKLANVTAEDIAKLAGKDRSVVSRIYTGRQKMGIEWAKVFAQALNQPVAEVLKRAGEVSSEQAQQMTPGFAESDVAPFTLGPGLGSGHTVQSVATALGGGRPGIDVWRVKGQAMALAGMLEGDFFLLDTHQAERVRQGDMVVAQIYTRGGAKTVLRRFEPPVLVAASPSPTEGKVHVVDGVNVVIRGKVTAVWRA